MNILAVIPPSTVTTDPVVHAEDSDARNTAIFAISSPVPYLFIGMYGNQMSLVSSRAFWLRSTGTTPGARARTLIVGAHSAAMLWVSAFSAALDIAYADINSTAASVPCMDEMLMTTPLPDCFIPPTSCLLSKYGARTLTA